MFFVFKQKTAYEMRISDWSSDVCSSDLLPNNGVQLAREPYTGIFGGPVAITPEWKMYDLQGIADRDYAAGELLVSMHLASGKQTPEFGQLFGLALGPAPEQPATATSTSTPTPVTARLATTPSP